MTQSDVIIIEELIELQESDDPEDVIEYYRLLVVASDPVIEALVAYSKRSYIKQ